MSTMAPTAIAPAPTPSITAAPTVTPQTTMAPSTIAPTQIAPTTMPPTSAIEQPATIAKEEGRGGEDRGGEDQDHRPGSD